MHYLFLMSIEDPEERSFYEIEANGQNWSVRKMRRQFNSSLYERLAMNRKKKDDALVETTLPKENKQIFASRYKLLMPSKAQLRRQIQQVRVEGKKLIMAIHPDFPTSPFEILNPITPILS